MSKAKKILSILSIIFSMILPSGCKNITLDQQKNMNSTGKYGSLSIKTGNDSRYLSKDGIATAKITISGSDIDEKTESLLSLDNIPVSNGKNTSPIIIEQVPVGNNRIITVQAFGKDGTELPKFQMRNVVDIYPDTVNPTTISRRTTAYADVLYGLKGKYALSGTEEDLKERTEFSDTLESSIINVIDTEIDPCLVNTKAIISDVLGYSTLSGDYTFKTGSLKFDYLIKDGFTACVEDPISKPLTNSKAGKNLTISNIAPGKWPLFLKDSDGNIIEKIDEVEIKSAEVTSLGHIDHKGIVILMRASKGYDSIHFWDASDNRTKTTWPGVKFPEKITYSAPLEDSDTEYYIYDFNGCSEIKCLVTNSKGEKYCSTDMNATRYGIYSVHYDGLVELYSGGQPDIEEPEFDLSVTENDFKKCYIDDPKNRRVVMLFNTGSSYWNTTPSSGYVKFCDGIDDYSYNGNKFNLQKSSTGDFWYAFVPYNKFGHMNQSGQPAYAFYIDNNKKSIPSFLPAGYIYTKVSQNTKNSVVILSNQDEETVKQNIINGPTAKKLSDFDLNTEKGQMEISNFRLCPGTKNLYRSYHPYLTSEGSGHSGTETKRLELVKTLGQKFGCQSEIDLSGSDAKDELRPSYLKNAVKVTVGYTKCYGSAAGSDFGNGLAQIVRFINKYDGPYQIHCRIGTDRTGVYCAVLEALCGADLETIKADYYKSVNMGIIEYRGPGAVCGPLQDILKTADLDLIPDLQKAMTDYFVNGGYVTREELSQMVSRLNQE